MKTSELTGAALDWAVAKAKDCLLLWYGVDNYSPSTNWAQGGPLVERECIELEIHDHMTMEWIATRLEGSSVADAKGPTPLIAAMRCYVSSKLGDTVEVPAELTTTN